MSNDLDEGVLSEGDSCLCALQFLTEREFHVVLRCIKISIIKFLLFICLYFIKSIKLNA